MRLTTLTVMVLGAALLAAGCGGGGGRRGGGGGGGGGGNAPEGPRWEKLGSRMVNFHGDHDTIAAGGQGDFRQIRIDVDRADLEMYNIRVNFGNGEHWSPDTRIHFKEGSWSRTIDLPGHVRHIKTVEFWYKTSHRGEGRANIDLFGRH